jgi:hypothetical protein
MITRAVLFWQGIYYVATGIWSLVSIDTFQSVTGPKTDTWLVKTVGALVLAIGCVLTFSAFKRRIPVETAMLAAGTAAGLAAIDTAYVSKGRIAPVYLLDAAAEVVGLLILIRRWGR